MTSTNGIERRAHERLYSDNLLLAVKFGIKEFGPSDPVIKLNISKGGAAFITDREAEIGQKVLLEGSFIGASAENIPATVVSKRKVIDMYRINVQFDSDEMTERAEDQIDTLVNAVSLTA